MNLGEPIFQKVDANEGISNFMRGFAMVAQINQHKQQQALQIQKMQQDAIQQEKENALKSRQLDISAQHYDHVYDIEKKQQDRIAQRELFVAGQTKAQTEAAAALMDDVTSIDAEHNSQEWRDRVYDTLLKHPGASRSPEYNLLAKQASKTMANPAVKTQQSVLDATIGRLGVDKKSVYRALNNPDAFTSAIPGDPNRIGIYIGDKPMRKGEDVIDNPEPGLGHNKQTFIEPTKLHVPLKKSTWDGLKTTFDSINGESDGTARMLPQPAPDTPQPKTLDAPTAKMFLQQSGGDKDKARKLAIDSGYTF